MATNYYKAPDNRLVVGPEEEAEAVARATLEGVRRGRFAITPGVQLTALAWLHSLIAPVLRWSFDRTAARVRQQGDSGTA